MKDTVKNINGLNAPLVCNIPELEEDSGNIFAVQELGECIKWLAELQIYQGNKESTDFYSGDNACGSWYSAKITQVLADKIIAETEKIFNSLNGVVTKGE